MPFARVRSFMLSGVIFTYPKAEMQDKTTNAVAKNITKVFRIFNSFMND